ncbi:bifunctional DNA-formamidopyrimidine glycosylase/DNA-(apurinic or apyrimidinic site) lyase [Devriesea agamarum]|uniref:bifunctional DNA-formamidopyrimidine glycosylase/DNA-(apurinic or apyrimidinic site) lyase n=1 Tax=Devriesea agamarum TaxID=472569 RepID=UPI00071E53C9|nr:bifunctional DNA-formamidopyrimidine glycosylase/DNA-(apurinic or apyrimidinic site) lyase [Devriesea agamarum]
MPELPEVEVVRRGLLPYVLWRRIEEVQVVDSRIVRRHGPGPADFAARIQGRRIDAIARRGKFLWWELDGDEALIVHLGMSGQLRVRNGHGHGHSAGITAGRLAPEHEGVASDPERHRRLSIFMHDGDRVDLIDQRMFGGMWISPLIATPDGALGGDGAAGPRIPLAASHIARDVLDPAADVQGAARAWRTRKAPIKSLLLAQDLLSGIGNIYADEALWTARVHPLTPGCHLSQRAANAIVRGCAEVMQRALSVGGTSFDALYVNVYGRRGYFAQSLNAYGRDRHPCPRCGTLIVRERFMNRSSHFCPRCQRRR